MYISIIIIHYHELQACFKFEKVCSSLRHCGFGGIMRQNFKPLKIVDKSVKYEEKYIDTLSFCS